MDRPATRRARGGPTNYSDVDWVDLVPVQLVTARQQSARHPTGWRALSGCEGS
jgi:hypothetical protein